MYHWGCGAYQVCSNDDPKLTLTYLMSRSNLLPYAFKWDFLNVDFNTLKPKSLFSLDMLILMRQWLFYKFERLIMTFQPKSFILESHQHIKT